MAHDHGFDALYEEHYRRLVVSLRLAVGAVGAEDAEDAEDVAQEAFARTLERWSRVRTGSSPAGYVYRVAFRLQNRRASRQRRWQRVAGFLQVRASRRHEAQPSVPGDLWAEAAAVRSALATLPLGARQAAALCLYAEMTPAEAADVLGLSPSTLRTQLQRARTALMAATSLSSEDDEQSREATPTL